MSFLLLNFRAAAILRTTPLVDGRKKVATDLLQVKVKELT
jgi:hypothetical protein